MTKRTLIGERGYQDCERLQGEPSWQCEHILVNVMVYVYYLYDRYLNLLFKPSTKRLDNPILNITVVVRIQLDISTKTGLLIYGPIVLFCFLGFLAFDFCRFWSFVFSSPPQRPMTSDLEGCSIPDFIHYIYFPILNALQHRCYIFTQWTRLVLQKVTKRPLKSYLSLFT